MNNNEFCKLLDQTQDTVIKNFTETYNKDGNYVIEKRYNPNHYIITKVSDNVFVSIWCDRCSDKHLAAIKVCHNNYSLAKSRSNSVGEFSKGALINFASQIAFQLNKLALTKREKEKKQLAEQKAYEEKRLQAKFGCEEFINKYSVAAGFNKDIYCSNHEHKLYSFVFDDEVNNSCKYYFEYLSKEGMAKILEILADEGCIKRLS